MFELWLKVRVVLGAVPAWAAAVSAVLSAVSTSVVPVLPVAWQVKAAAIVAAISGAVAFVVKAVASVTPVPPSERGLLPPQ